MDRGLIFHPPMKHTRSRLTPIAEAALAAPLRRLCPLHRARSHFVRKKWGGQSSEIDAGQEL